MEMVLLEPESKPSFMTYDYGYRIPRSRRQVRSTETQLQMLEMERDQYHENFSLPALQVSSESVNPIS